MKANDKLDDDALRDALAFTRAMLAEDREAASAIFDNTPSQKRFAIGLAWVAAISWSWPDAPDVEDFAQQYVELGAFLQEANEYISGLDDE